MAGLRPMSVGERDALALHEWIGDETTGATLVVRARIVLLSAAGLGPTAIADELGCSKQTVVTWRERYRVGGLEGLHDAPRSGRPAVASGEAIVVRTLAPPPPGAARWTSRTLGADLGVSNVVVAKAWRGWGVIPGGPARVSLGTEPALAERVSAVVGVHVSASARVLAVVSDRGSASAHDRPIAPDKKLLSMLLAGAGAPSSRAGGVATAGFLSRLDGQMPRRAGGSLRMLVDPASDEIRSWAAARDRVVLHTVPAGLSWARLSWVACQLAATNEEGSSSSEALVAAMAQHRPGETFSWTRP